MAKTRKGRSGAKRGGGYSFAGGLFGNNTTDGRGGNPGWDNTTSTDCGAVAGRGGNDMTGGKRRRVKRGGMVPDPPPSHGGRRHRRRHTRGGAGDNASLTLNRGQGGGKRRRTRRRGGNRGGNGNPDLAQQVPRANYSFQGQGERGIPNYAPDTY